MLVFIIPLKSPRSSKSWAHVSKLFERTVKSACNQTSPDFRALVVCNQKPEIDFNHTHITYIETNFSIPKEINIEARYRTDKGRKVLAGLTYAKKFNPVYAMAVDADDCVSKHLVEFINQSPRSNGWYIDSGYQYLEGSQDIYSKRKNFYRICGTANIIKYDLIDLPLIPEYNRGYGYYKFYIEHQNIRNIMFGKGTSLAPLPFAGAIYILGTGENTYGNEKRLPFNSSNRQSLTPSIRDEFGLYDILM